MNALTSVAHKDQRAAENDDYRRSIRNWLAENLPAHFRRDSSAYRAPVLDEQKQFEAAMHKAGLVGVAWPKAYGGHGLSLREHLVISQEIGRLAMPESVNSIGKELAGPIIQVVGSEDQKQRFLPSILRMETIWCQGFSEPGAGSDLAGLRTKAVREGDEWVINGQKIWTSGAYRSQRCLLLARTGTVEDRHRGLALFAVDMSLPGINVRQIKSIDGKESFCEVFFDNVRVQQCDALGEPDEGWLAAVRVLSIERATNRMHRTWRFENELQHLLRTCRDAPVLAPLLKESDYRRRIAATLADIEVLKAYVEGVVEAISIGEAIGARGSLYKLFWSEAHQRFSVLALEMLSKAPVDAGPEVANAIARFNDVYLLGRSETIYAGTTEIQLGIIADRILELPRVK
ncbi:acyl-CoA dehydrogenase family protein [Mesorhizobium sp. CAU 1741]|uniref:acyl-CoA dehydrogenase family protein n=1 Tax=Mesorhizobium sp. CAU 1741 TaxID=3140366 RepID=UPI00325AA4E3